MSQGRLLRSSAVVDDIQDVDSWRCTDVLFLAIFSLFWAGLVIISFGAFATGDLSALEFGTDYLGNRCGQGKFADRPAVWYPRMSEDLGSQWMILHEHPSALVMYGLCLPECPRRPAAPIADYGYAEGHPGAKAAYWPVAMSTYNAINHCLPQVETNATTRSYCEFPSCDKAGEKCQRVVGVPHSVWEMSTREQFSKCARQIDVHQQTYAKQPNTGPIIDYLLTIASTVNAAADMVRLHMGKIFLFGVGLSTLLALAWMVFLYLCAGIAVYLALFAVGLTLLLFTVAFAYRGGVGGSVINTFVSDVVNGTLANVESGLSNTVASSVLTPDVLQATMDAALTQEVGEMRSLYQALAILSAIVLVLYVIMLCLASGQIGRTVALVKEATLVVHNSKVIVFFPLVVSAAQLVLIAFCVLTLAYLHTSPAASYASQLEYLESAYSYGEPDAPAASNASGLLDLEWIGSLDADEVLLYKDVYVVFGLLWTFFFLAAIGTTTISGCVFYFFFVDVDTAGHINQQFADNQTDFVVSTMLTYVLRYNLGSMAFGSLILAVVETLVWLLETLNEQTQAKQDSNPLVRVVMKCCKCCMFCFERCLKFVSGYAYIFVFMQNTGFCTACFRTWRMMSSFPLQLSINRIVQRVLFAMQSITIPLVCTAFGYAYFVSHSGGGLTHLTSDTLVGGMVPAFFVFLLAMVMARSFASVYEQVVSALTVCVLQDITQYNAKYARDQLRDAFDLPPKKFTFEDDDDDVKPRSKRDSRTSRGRK